MNTRILMTLSAGALAPAGFAATFLPQELLARAGVEPGAATVLIVQALGALYLGFAMLNWMARGNLIGGIYSRPVAIGNFMHFAVLAAALLKAVFAGNHAPAMLVVAALYALFAIAFGLVAFTAPPAKA